MPLLGLLMGSGEFPAVLGAVAGSTVAESPLHEYSNIPTNERLAG